MFKVAVQRKYKECNSIVKMKFEHQIDELNDGT
jgi:hypothetical protein